MKMLKNKVMLYAYLNSNFGDDLFVKIFLDRYTNTKFKFIGNKNYLETFKNKTNQRIIYTSNFYFRLIRRILTRLGKMDILYKILSKDCDYNLFVGGSLFIESDNIEEQTKYYSDLLSNRKKSFLCGTNFGPYKTQEFYEYFSRYIDCFEDVCFREHYSKDMFSMKNNVRYAPDIVFNLKYENKSIVEDSKLVLISVKYFKDSKLRELYQKNIVSIIRGLVEEGYRVAIVSFCEIEGDSISVNEIISKVQDLPQEKIQAFYYNSNINDCLDLFLEARYVLATRYHAMIIGFLFNKITIPIIYNPKMTNVLEDMNYTGLQYTVEKMDMANVNDIINYFSSASIIDISKIITEAENCFEVIDLYLRK